jgi:hypothetical protein
MHHTTDAYKGMEADLTAPLILDVVMNEWSSVCCIKTFEAVITADIGCCLMVT